MRLKKGSKVEVLSKKEASSGCWLGAEIISGNEHTYCVKYDWRLKNRQAVVERVPRKAIRPCPPPVEGPENWVTGDLVEVFRNPSWKTATIAKVLGGKIFFVRLLGSSGEFRLHRSYLRVRQSWQDGNWFVIGKDTGNCTTSARKEQTGTRIKPGVEDDCFSVEGNNGTSEPHTVSARTLKRSFVGSTDVDAYAVAVQKMRAIEKDGSPQRMFPGHTSFHNVTTGFSETDASRGKPNGFNDRILAETPIPIDTDSSASSVGSCSGTGNGLHNLPLCSLKHHSADTESHCSDAESFCRRGYREEGCPLATNGKKKIRWRISVKHSTFQDKIKQLQAKAASSGGTSQSTSCNDIIFEVLPDQHGRLWAMGFGATATNTRDLPESGDSVRALESPRESRPRRPTL